MTILGPNGHPAGVPQEAPPSPWEALRSMIVQAAQATDARKQIAVGTAIKLLDMVEQGYDQQMVISEARRDYAIKAIERMAGAVVIGSPPPNLPVDTIKSVRFVDSNDRSLIVVDSIILAFLWKPGRNVGPAVMVLEMKDGTEVRQEFTIPAAMLEQSAEDAIAALPGGAMTGTIEDAEPGDAERQSMGETVGDLAGPDGES